MNFHPDVPYFVNLRLECDIKDRHRVTSSKRECREIRYGESNNLLTNERGKFSRIVGIFRPIEINIGKRNIYEMLLTDFYIHKIDRERHLYPYLSHLFSDCVKLGIRNVKTMLF